MRVDIWEDDPEDLFQLSPIRVDDINRAEKLLDVKLPQAYKELVQIKNGGSIKYNACPSPVPTSWAEDHVGIDHLMGIGDDGGILESPYFIKEWGMPKGLVLLHGDGHCWIALDYRKTKENPPVIFIDN
jgi:hypothetical protein